MAEPVGSYEHMSEKYGAKVDDAPANKLYERPNTCSLFPANLKGLKVLDLGCGSGWYCDQLLKAGAIVTAVDASESLLNLAKDRCKGEIQFFHANLEKPMDFLKNEQFDFILSALVIHYIEDWFLLFKEISRVLKPKGRIVLSTHHPCDLHFQRNKVENYFETQLLQEYWRNFEAHVQFYHHPLSDLTENLFKNGFLIERMLEPRFSLELKAARPDFYERCAKKPCFLFVRALKCDISDL